MLVSSVSLRTTDRPGKGRDKGHVIHFKILHPFNFLWNSRRSNRQILCPGWAEKCLSPDDKLSPRWVWSRSRDVLIFWQISVNTWKTVQDTDILTMEDYR